MIKQIKVLILLGVLLAGCAGWGAVEQPASLPAETATYVPAPTWPPTATAVAFEYRATSTPPPTNTPIPTNFARPFTASSLASDINPLTGLKVDKIERLNRRPISVKVTNFPRGVRPQWGLSLADHVYEYYLEDDMTRFVGIFYGQDASRVGPVRSGRLFDENIVRMYKAIIVFGFGDNKVMKELLDSNIRQFLVIEHPDNCPPLCRIGPQNAYNTLFLNTEQVGPYIEGLNVNNDRQNLDGLQFSIRAPAGLPGSKVSIRYSYFSYHYWQFDSTTNRYMRFQETEDDMTGDKPVYQPLTDKLTGQQIGADNLVILQMAHRDIREPSPTEIYEMNFAGMGKALAFRENVITPIVWHRDARDLLLTLEYEDGRPYALKPGTTWFEILGETSTQEQLPDGAWRFVFGIP